MTWPGYSLAFWQIEVGLYDIALSMAERPSNVEIYLGEKQKSKITGCAPRFVGKCRKLAVHYLVVFLEKTHGICSSQTQFQVASQFQKSCWLLWSFDTMWCAEAGDDPHVSHRKKLIPHRACRHMICKMMPNPKICRYCELGGLKLQFTIDQEWCSCNTNKKSRAISMRCREHQTNSQVSWKKNVPECLFWCLLCWTCMPVQFLANLQVINFNSTLWFSWFNGHEPMGGS